MRLSIRERLQLARQLTDGFRLRVEMLNSTKSATVEFVFAPEERDVYRYRPTLRGLAPLGAKPGCGRLPTHAKAVALLRSAGSKTRTASYKHLAPMGRRRNNVSTLASVASSAGSHNLWVEPPGSASPSPGAITLSACFAARWGLRPPATLGQLFRLKPRATASAVQSSGAKPNQPA
jgi:hypothetical protein